MLRIVFCLHRLPHLTRAEFQDYWFTRHGPLVRQHAAVLGIRRYVQVHSVDDALSAGMRAVRGAPDAYDGVAELWVDDDAFEAARRDPAARDAGRILLEDERRFIDLARSPLWLARERPIVETVPRADAPGEAQKDGDGLP
jgi:uncharacterized protein (TIGR02118 family)